MRCTGEAWAIARSTARLAAIRDLLEHDSVCRDIVRYFSRHTEAADTARGIAEWWIGRDVSSTAEALGRLERRGVVHSCLVQDSTAVYAYTKNPLLRETLHHWINAAPRPAAEPA